MQPLERIRSLFCAWGWLLPVLLPLTQLGGRALFNIVAYSYVLWALLAIPYAWPRAPRGYWIAYGVLLISFLPGLAWATYTSEAVKAWCFFTLHSATALFTLAMLQRCDQALPRLLHALGIMALLVVLGLYLKLGWLYLKASGVNPELDLSEDNLPWLLPLGLYWLEQHYAANVRARWLAVGGFLLLLFAYIVMSQGRAAMLGALLALVVYAVAVWGWCVRRVLQFGALGLALAVGLSIVWYLNNPVRREGWEYLIDGFTSGRTVLWRQAWEYPPANTWFGVGLDHVRYYAEVLQIREGLRVKHLHNFIFDSWYETGWIGSLALLALLGYVLRCALCGWQQLDRNLRQLRGVWLASMGAILIAALLSFSYLSRQFSLYQFIAIAALLYLCTPKPISAREH